MVVKTHYHRKVLWTDVDRPIRNDTVSTVVVATPRDLPELVLPS